ncbi:chemotaxis protein CheA [Oceaniserpentilla sp. 4NH20-0058]|uniref:chemotaxis protein CheA n=1 Tax=Oceaniserpentilla sp. 4NH20-0058 TaxID=3127660 RepID=UPI00310268D4
MSIDLSQFHQVFYEESYEGLDAMEQGLLDLDLVDPDAEVINTIFRAAHSMKGGAGTFGFTHVAEFTHVLETLLDQIRSGQRAMSQGIQNLLLTSVDCIRGLMQGLQSGAEADLTDAHDLKQQFEAILSNETPADVSDETIDTNQTSVEEETGGSGWHIRFIPELTLLQTGNEPVRMFRQLADACDGQMKISVDTTRLPVFTSMDPEMCYLVWEVQVDKAIDRSVIDEIFEWVIDDAEIIITPLGESSVIKEVVEPVPQAIQPKEEKTLSKPVEKEKPSTKQPAKTQESSSIRVSIDKVDSLINMVGELVITQSMLGQLGQNFDITRVQRLQEGLAQLEHNTRELQESVMKIRMMPISFVFSRFPRLVRDVSISLDKKINLEMSGENTELDKTVMEKIGDPMVHLIRNSIDHGIEMPADRIAAGKAETGTVKLDAYHQSGNIVIEIKDDGAGLNTDRILQKAIENGLVAEGANLSQEQIFDLIFQPGFSTADVVSDLSGRGVGMDVVRRNIAALNGSIEVSSERGKGSRFVIRLPLTLAILDGQLVQVGKEIYIFPLVSIVESIQLDDLSINNVGGHSDVLQLRDEYVPIVHLDDIFNIANEKRPIEESIIVVVETDGEKIGVVVDELLGQQQVVIKSLEENYKRVDGISGATILGDGTVALIVDISSLTKMSGASSKIIDGSHKAA